MQVPVQITVRNMAASPALCARIRALAARLGKFSSQIIHCRVVVARPPAHHSHGGRFDVRMDIAVPDREISVRRARHAHPSHDDPYVALRDIFLAARRRLQEYERERRLDVKAHTRLPPRPRRSARTIRAEP
jgi:ribosome-associated translation inhibitor RaiA